MGVEEWAKKESRKKGDQRMPIERGDKRRRKHVQVIWKDSVMERNRKMEKYGEGRGKLSKDNELNSN